MANIKKISNTEKMSVLRRAAKTVYDIFYVKVFPDYRCELEKAVGSAKSLLDVGCGSDSPIKKFSQKLYCVGVDCFEPSIEKSRKNRIHKEYVKANVLEIGARFKENAFECVLASDLIEHLTKEEGEELLRQMEKIASKKVIIYTPNGFLPQGEFESNPWQVHKSGWEVEEMRKKGYKVYGIHGWKKLRGECANLRFKPKIFWMLLSDVTQKFVKKRPQYAFQIMCVKNVKKEHLR